MTNEEKAQEIATKICGYAPSSDNFDITGEYGCAEDSALEMAEWKDQQFVSMTREWFQDNAWSFAHSVDGESLYDTEMALKSFELKEIRCSQDNHITHKTLYIIFKYPSEICYIYLTM